MFKPVHCAIALAIGMFLSMQVGAQQQTPQGNDNRQSGRAQSDTPKTTQNSTQNTTQNASPLDKIKEMNQAEIELGHLAMTKAQNPAVRTYAQKLVEDHGKAMEMLGNSDRTSSLPPSHDAINDQAANQPGTIDNQDVLRQKGGDTGNTDNQDVLREKSATPKMSGQTLSPEHQQIQMRLSSLSGAQFDREFIDVMVREHQTAIRMLEQQAGASNPQTGATSNNADTSRPNASSRNDNTTRSSGDNSGPNATSRNDNTTANNRDNSTPNATPRNDNPSTNRQAGATTDSSRDASGAYSTSRNDDIATIARNMLPTLRQHLAEAQQIQKQLSSGNVKQ